MIRINLVCVGTLKEKYWTQAVEEYTKRISRYATFNIVECPEKRTVDEEGKEILKKLKGYVVVFDIGGKIVSSPDISDLMRDRLNAGTSEFSFVIGGSDGLSEEVRSRADFAMSFGRVTYPHQLMRVIASEQIYRALTIMNNVTYHK